MSCACEYGRVRATRRRLPARAQSLVYIGSLPSGILLHINQVLGKLSKLPQNLSNTSALNGTDLGWDRRLGLMTTQRLASAACSMRLIVAIAGAPQ